MKINANWVRDFVNIPVDDAQFARDITMAGLGVEGETRDGDNMIFEVEFTTNRPDQMNHYGVARECSAIYDTELKPLAPKLPAAKGTPSAKVIIEDAQGCARYTARVVRFVNVGFTPEKIVDRLATVDQRSINNAADATNFTLWEMGHPTHVFDLDLLEGQTIIVRRAKAGETLKTLDGVERKLSPEDLVIADAAKPVALAGVIGGEDTKVTEKTRNILIESAWFDPVAIRKTSKRHGLHTDASHRFERGADFGVTPVACNRVAELILASGGGELEGDLIDVIARNVGHMPVWLRAAEVERILGKALPDNEVARILARLGFRPTARQWSAGAHVSATTVGVGGAHAAIAEEANGWMVEIPTWRLDVEREIDLIEEIARIHGYDNFPNTLPSFAGGVHEMPVEAKRVKVRASLLALGYNEALSLTFNSQADARTFANAQPVEIANPLSEEASFMRTSLVPNMLDMLARNLNYGTTDVRLFDVGAVYERLGERTEEHEHVALGATGNAEPASVHGKARPYSFFDMKGDVETLLAGFDHHTLYFDTNTPEYFHPGRSARIVFEGGTVGYFGQLHPDVAAARKLKQDVFVAELQLDRLFKRPLREPRYTAAPRFPAVDRDFSFIFDDAVTFERMRGLVEALRIPELRSFMPVETFRGGAISAGQYSLLLRAEFQSTQRTLRDEEVATWAQQIIKALESLGGSLRAS